MYPVHTLDKPIEILADNLAHFSYKFEIHNLHE